jgi:hypothetical protein
MQPIIASLPVLSTPADDSAAWFERFGLELDAIEARGGLLTTLVPAESFANELVKACGECLDGRDDSDIPADDRDPAWDEVWTTDEPAFTDEDLLRGVPMFPLDHPTRRADADDLAAAHEVGYQLGTDGFTIRDVTPPSYMTAAECDHFMAGLESGEAKLWEEFHRDMEELDDRNATMDALYGFPHAEINEAELASAGCR